MPTRLFLSLHDVLGGWDFGPWRHLILFHPISSPFLPAIFVKAPLLYFRNGCFIEFLVTVHRLVNHSFVAL